MHRIQARIRVQHHCEDRTHALQPAVPPWDGSHLGLLIASDVVEENDLVVEGHLALTLLLLFGRTHLALHVL